MGAARAEALLVGAVVIAVGALLLAGFDVPGFSWSWITKRKRLVGGLCLLCGVVTALSPLFES